MVWFRLTTTGTDARIVIMTNMNTLDEIRTKGAEKLQLTENPDELHVYMMDGAEICCDEDLIDELINANMLLLAKTFKNQLEPCVVREDKAKRSLESELKMMKTENIDDNSDDRFVTPPSKKKKMNELNESPCPSPSMKSDNSSDSSTSFEAGDMLELPPFTSTVKCALRDGDCSTAVWNMMMEQMVQFYVANFPNRLKTPADYKIVGEQMYRRYPCIKREGKRPYSYLCHLLSGRIRTWRHTNKYKMNTGTNDNDIEKERSVTTEVVPKKETLTGTLREVLDDTDYTRMMRECRKECSKNSLSRSHVKNLLKKTFPNRRREIERMNKEGVGMMSSVILDWSCFEYGEFILDEMKGIINKTDKEMDKLKSAAKKVVKALETIIPKKMLTSKGERRTVQMIEYIGKEVSTKKGKVFVPVIIHNDVKEKEMDDILTTEANTAPLLHLFFNKGTFESSHIAGDSEKVDTQAYDVMIALMIYIAAFFVFNVGFGDHGQFLGFFQQALFSVPYTEGKKGQGFNDMYTKFDDAMQMLQEEAKYKKPRAM